MIPTQADHLQARYAASRASWWQACYRAGVVAQPHPTMMGTVPK